MKIYSPAFLAAAASGQVAIAELLALEFPCSPVYLNSSNWHIPFGGKTYQGAAGLGTIRPVADQPGQVVGLSLSMSATSPATLSLAMDGAGTVKGTPCTLRIAVFAVAQDGSLVLADAPLLWAGALDTMSLSLDGTTRTVSVTAESTAIRLMRSIPWLYSDADQRLVNALDGSFSFLADQIGKPIVWPNRNWFRNNQ
jgi:hypothetical protein